MCRPERSRRLGASIREEFRRRLRQRSLLLFALALVSASWAAGQGIVEYRIQVELDPTGHRLEGRQQVRWKNQTPVPTDELWFHLYLNAFADEHTTFKRELGSRRLRSSGHGAGYAPGWITVSRLVLSDGTDLLPTLQFERPDDGNSSDSTVAKVSLPSEVPPGAWVEFETEFEAQLPEVIARTGYAGDFHMVGQWFPKLGVFEGERGWNCHQFHATTEFFADFGRYDVEIVVPSGWLVVASGVELSRERESTLDRVTFRADRVHDFAWSTAPPDSMALIDSSFEPGRDVPSAWLASAAQKLGRGSDELELPQTKIRLLLPVDQRPLANRMLKAVRLAMAWYGLNLGPYPYPQLTVVSPPPAADEAGGMEYPTLITTGALLADALPLFRRFPGIESVTVHEVGHQYFYGLVATNEFEQAWLDEGITTYTELECMEAIRSDGHAPEIEAPVGYWARERLYYSLASTLPVRLDQPAWSFRTSWEYYSANYSKAALVMKSLEGVMGSEPMAQALRAYVERFRYGHPRAEDLFAVLEEHSEHDLKWFFDQAIRGDATPDWGVAGVSQRTRASESDEDPGAPAEWHIEVDLVRRGDLIGPVDVLLSFENGDLERRRWDGQSRWVRWRIDSDAAMDAVVVDPEGAWLFETHRVDNYWRRGQGEQRRPLWWLMAGLRLCGLLPGVWS